MMARVDHAYRAYALHRRLVADMTTEGIAGVRRVHDYPAIADYFDGVAYQPRLRIDRMNGKQLCQRNGIAVGLSACAPR